MIGFSVLVFIVFNYGIYEKEQIINNGQKFLLELAPVDPRSLMQGDYMRLRYAMERDVPTEELVEHGKRGYLVIRLDGKLVAHFVRVYKEENLAEGEYLLRFLNDTGKAKIVPDSFMFQEGHAQYYENAKYGVFTLGDSGQYLLIGLADADGELLSARQPMN